MLNTWKVKVQCNNVYINDILKSKIEWFNYLKKLNYLVAN